MPALDPETNLRFLISCVKHSNGGRVSISNCPLWSLSTVCHHQLLTLNLVYSLTLKPLPRTKKSFPRLLREYIVSYLCFVTVFSAIQDTTLTKKAASTSSKMLEAFSIGTPLPSCLLSVKNRFTMHSQAFTKQIFQEFPVLSRARYP